MCVIVFNTTKKRCRLLLLLLCFSLFYAVNQSLLLRFEDGKKADDFTLYTTERNLEPTPEERLMIYARRVKKRCTETDKLNENRTPKGLLLFRNQSERVLWCPVYKAATRSLRIFFLEQDEFLTWDEKIGVVGESVERSNLNLLTEAVSTPVKRRELRILMSQQPFAFEKSLVIVRHPFDRLVSAFRDKLERSHDENADLAENDYYFNKFGRGIFQRYRSQAIQRFGDEHFAEGNNFGAVLKPAEGHRTKHYPIFWEFVQWLFKKGNAYRDEHWAPQTIRCGVCTVRYDLMAKFEDLRDVVNGNETNLDVVKAYVSPNWREKRSRGLSRFLPGDARFIQREMSTEEITQTYFSTLDDENIAALYHIYKKDFELLGYRFHFRNKTYGPASEG